MSSLTSISSAFSFRSNRSGNAKSKLAGDSDSDANKDAASAKTTLLKPDTFVATPAYDQLMADFFPAPNILLEDGTAHANHKRAWEDQLADFTVNTAARVREIADRHVEMNFGRRRRAKTERHYATPPPAAAAAPAINDGSVDEVVDEDTVDLYGFLKTLSWEILLGIVLDVAPSDNALSSSSSHSPSHQSDYDTANTKHQQPSSLSSDFAEIETLQEMLLRGQFSLFPVSFNARVWQSARSKGIQARKELQVKLKQIVDQQRKKMDANTRTDSNADASTSTKMPRCPLLKAGKVSDEQVASHALLFTSSIAVKALASLLMAVTMNLFLWRDVRRANKDREMSCGGSDKLSPTQSLANLIRTQCALSSSSPLSSSESQKRKRELLNSVILETERLSPPVIGLMRRAQHDIVLHTDVGAEQKSDDGGGGSSSRGDNKDESQADRKKEQKKETDTNGNSDKHAVQAGHDVWLYLPLAARDTSAFGPDAAIFKWDRYLSSSPSPSPSSPQPPPPLTFGFGPKSCIGASLIHNIITIVAEAMIDSGIDLSIHPGTTEEKKEEEEEGRETEERQERQEADENPNVHGDHQAAIIARGVRAWLGWDQGTNNNNIINSSQSKASSSSSSAAAPSSQKTDTHQKGSNDDEEKKEKEGDYDDVSNLQRAVARDLKQLPVQRPRESVLVRVS